MIRSTRFALCASKRKLKLIKRIIIGIIAVIIGIGLALLADSFFREQIQNIFLWSTSNRIKFTGKNFHLFNSNFYYVSFGVSFLIFCLGNINKQLKRILKSGILNILIFTVVLITTSSVDANMKVAECTACDDGIRTIHWNGINYGLILGISILISVIPSVIALIKNLKKDSLLRWSR